MRITFVLPGHANHPIGGYLVVFRYANDLSRHGHHVTIVHAHEADLPQGVCARSRRSYHHIRRRARLRSGRPEWFELDARVNVRLTADFRESSIPDADAILATACTTASSVAGYRAKKGAKFYLIQGYEEWWCGKEITDLTWRLPLHKLVASKWLFEIGVGLGERERMTHVPPGVELDVFQNLIPHQSRSRVRLGLLAHEQPIKGLKYAVEALESARSTIPGLDVVAFGGRDRPSSLPTWVEYVKSPTRPQLAALLNSLALFLHSSESEGWGLPAAEAMACGCALVASDSGGVRDYALDGETALLVPPRDASALAAAVLRLMGDDELRTMLSHKGWEEIQQYSAQRAADQLEHVINEVVLART